VKKDERRKKKDADARAEDTDASRSTDSIRHSSEDWNDELRLEPHVPATIHSSLVTLHYKCGIHFMDSELLDSSLHWNDGLAPKPEPHAPASFFFLLSSFLIGEAAPASFFFLLSSFLIGEAAPASFFSAKASSIFVDNSPQFSPHFRKKIHTYLLTKLLPCEIL